MAKNAGEVAKKWQANLQNAVTSIKAGINAVTVSPSSKAIAKKDSYLQGVNENVDKWARNLGRVTLEQWKDAALNVGIMRLQTGAAKGLPKMQAFMDEWLPYEETLRARIDAMPKGTLEASIARATEAIRYNKAFRRRG